MSLFLSCFFAKHVDLNRFICQCDVEGPHQYEKYFFNFAIPHGLINFWFDDSWHWVKSNVSWFTTEAERSCGQGSSETLLHLHCLVWERGRSKRCSCSSDSEFLQNSAHFVLFKDKIRDPATRFHRLDDPQAAWKVNWRCCLSDIFSPLHIMTFRRFRLQLTCACTSWVFHSLSQ